MPTYTTNITVGLFKSHFGLLRPLNVNNVSVAPFAEDTLKKVTLLTKSRFSRLALIEPSEIGITTSVNYDTLKTAVLHAGYLMCPPEAITHLGLVDKKFLRDSNFLITEPMEGYSEFYDNLGPVILNLLLSSKKDRAFVLTTPVARHMTLDQELLKAGLLAVLQK